MNILLIRPYFEFLKSEPITAIPEPLGLEYLASMVREKHNVQILDAVGENWRNIREVGDNVRMGMPLKSVLKKVKKFSPDLLGISCNFTSQAPITKRFTKKIKEVDPSITLITGGAHPSSVNSYFEENPDMDIVLRGETDYTFKELADGLERGRELKSIDGLMYMKDGKRILTSPRKKIENLDALPLPSRDLVPFLEYSNMRLMKHGLIHKLAKNKIIAYAIYEAMKWKNHPFPLPTASVITSRGCPNNCFFCSVHPVMGFNFRYRSPENILFELEALKDQYNINSVLFQDDNISMNRDRMIKLAKGMVERDLNLVWTTPSGAYVPSLDREVLEWIRKSGCYRLEFGIESGNQRVLDEVIIKNQKLGKVREVINICDELGFQTRGFFVIGLPGESKKEILDTIKFSAESKLGSGKVMIAQPFPGSRLYAHVMNKNLLVGDRDYMKLRVRTDKACIKTDEFTPEDIMQLRDIGNKAIGEKNYEKYRQELEEIANRPVPKTKTPN